MQKLNTSNQILKRQKEENENIIKQYKAEINKIQNELNYNKKLLDKTKLENQTFKMKKIKKNKKWNN